MGAFLKGEMTDEIIVKMTGRDMTKGVRIEEGMTDEAMTEEGMTKGAVTAPVTKGETMIDEEVMIDVGVIKEPLIEEVMTEGMRIEDMMERLMIEEVIVAEMKTLQDILVEIMIKEVERGKALIDQIKIGEIVIIVGMMIHLTEVAAAMMQVVVGEKAIAEGVDAETEELMVEETTQVVKRMVEETIDIAEHQMIEAPHVTAQVENAEEIVKSPHGMMEENRDDQEEIGIVRAFAKVAYGKE
mmetsp:Transcript_15744/g.23708  ORF Transcript_15744/g.23708 Transcript_15744/m.23708 type:complete len:242 (+) Transcript_15744:1778-2503(+)